jgi:hypothetical protein
MTLPIILCMIVRDEADTIAGVLEAARPYVDGFAIVDTGSVDGTVEAIDRVSGRLKAPGILTRSEWPGRFDVARSLAWELAEETFGPEDHLRLELSGDSYLSGELNREALQEPECNGAWVTSHMGPITWRRPKITRSGRGWKYVGRLHEYATRAAAEGDAPLVNSGLRIEHRGKVREQGGRDQYVAMMMADLEERPDDPRTVFYAAQTLDVAGRWGEARALYEQRIRMGGWEQERYVAALRVARRAVEDGWPTVDVRALGLRAANICPERPEAWELVATITRADDMITRLICPSEAQSGWLFYEPATSG